MADRSCKTMVTIPLQHDTGRPPETRLTRIVCRSLLVAMLVAHAALLIIGLRRNFVVVDEVGHVAAGVSHWQTGSFGLYRVNPPLCRILSALPVLLARPSTDYRRMDLSPAKRSEFVVGTDFAQANSSRYFDLVCLARLPGVVWSLIGAWVIFLWGRDLYGEAAGCLGAALWCFDPMVLAFAPVVTPDIPAAVAALAATYAFRRFLIAGGWANCVRAGVLLGIAELTKFTLVLLYAIWPFLWMIWRRWRRSRPAVRSVNAGCGLRNGRTPRYN